MLAGIAYSDVRAEEKAIAKSYAEMIKKYIADQSTYILQSGF